MSRAALVPFLGDPYLLKGWLHLYTTVWGKEVDQLYVLIHGQADKRIMKACEKMITGVGGKPLVIEGPILDHGDAINYLLSNCEEEDVVLLEDDGWILQSGIVDSLFKRVEEGHTDVIGSTRGSCSQELVDACTSVFKLIGSSPEHKESQCPNLWPNFVFIKKQHLLETDRNFNARNWEKGDVIPQLNNYSLKEFAASDTFVWATIQLRAQKLRFEYVHQRHCAQSDRDDSRTGTGLFGVNRLPWVHFGSLSSIMSPNGLLRDSKSVPLGAYELGTPDTHYLVFDEGTKPEILRRISVMSLFLQAFPLADSEFSFYDEIYDDAINLSLINYNLSLRDHKEFRQTYSKMLPALFSEIEV